MSPSTAPFQLTPSASTQSKAKLLRVLRKAIYLRGELFTIHIKVHNHMNADFPGGHCVANAIFATEQAEYLPCVIPKLGPGEDWESEPVDFNALAEGYALVSLDLLNVKGLGEVGVWVDDQGRDIWEGYHTHAIHGFHVETRRDYHTYFAFVASVVSLAILISERVFASVFPSWLYLGSWLFPSWCLQLGWYMALVVAALYVVFTEGRKGEDHTTKPVAKTSDNHANQAVPPTPPGVVQHESRPETFDQVFRTLLVIATVLLAMQLASNRSKPLPGAFVWVMLLVLAITIGSIAALWGRHPRANAARILSLEILSIPLVAFVSQLLVDFPLANLVEFLEGRFSINLVILFIMSILSDQFFALRFLVWTVSLILITAWGVRYIEPECGGKILAILACPALVIGLLAITILEL